MKKIAFLITLIAIAVMPVSAQNSTGAKAVDDPRGAIEFIETLAEETQAVWSDSKLTAEERSTAFRALFTQATDINLLARGMLGRHYRTITSAQKSEYMAAMRDYIVAEFDRRMAQIGFKQLDVVGTKPASGKRGHIFVKTQVMREEGQPILADWRIRKKSGKFQIVNLEFEGINMMITNRDVFSSKVKRNGVDGLISWLKNETAAANVATNTDD